jgi:hypothetical protein
MAEAKKGRGCLFYGCITLIVLAILLIAGLYFGVRFGVKYVRDHYTASTPISVAPVALNPTQGAAVTKRVDDFTKALEKGESPAPLELTSDELDYWIRNSKQGAQLKDHAHLSVTNGRIHAEMSVPLEAFNPAFKGRYLNGEGEFALTLRNGGITVDPQAVRVNGQPVPQQMFQNMNKPLEWKPGPNDEGAALVRGLERIEVKDDRVLLVPKGK